MKVFFFKNSEMLFQFLRFSDFPDTQKEIFNQKSPMAVKMIAKKHKHHLPESVFPQVHTFPSSPGRLYFEQTGPLLDLMSTELGNTHSMSAGQRRLSDGPVRAFCCSQPRASLPAHRHPHLRPTPWTGSRRRGLHQAILNGGEHLRMGGHATPEVQHQAPGVGDELRRPVHDFLQHRLDAPALGRMADRRDLAGQAQLPKETQAVVGEGRQMQQTIVGVELARRQPLQVQVGLEFGMELFIASRDACTAR
jgi:hypothetical protein